MIGEVLEFSVPLPSDTIIWTITSKWVNGIICDVQSCTPPISLEVTGNAVDPMELKVKTCGVEKTINIMLKVRPYIITYDSDGGTSIPPDSVEPGQPVKEPVAPAPVPLKPGYSLSGWKKSDGTVCTFPFPATEDITLKATWVPKTYTLTFDPKGGTVNPTSQSVTYDAPIGTLPTPTKDGYDFSGWYSDRDVEYKPTTLYKIDGEIILSAKWTPKKYEITFDVDSPDGVVNPTSKLVTYNEPVGILPTPTRVAHEFKGWYSLPIDGVEYKATTIYNTVGPITLYARWEFIKDTRPVIDLLTFTIPTGLVYNGAEITSLPTAVQKAGTYGDLGDITILYDGKDTPLPKDAGTYAIYAFIAKNIISENYYDTATVLLGSLTIDKAPATATITSVAAKSKLYDADTLAELDDIKFDVNPRYGDEVSPGDYTVSAWFDSPNVGLRNVKVTISWLPDGPLSKNYIISPSPLTSTTTAEIKQATGELRIIDSLFDKNSPLDPPFYEYTEAGNYAKRVPTHEVYKSPFISDTVEILFEYKRDTDPEIAYSKLPPNSRGLWNIRATLATTANYTGAMDWKVFKVIRGSAYPVIPTIEFSEDNFAKDSVLSDTLRSYYVSDSCEIENTTIKITIDKGEPDIVLKLGNNSPQRQGDENFGYYYEIPFSFGKPGLDTLFYTLTDTISDIYTYKQHDTLLIETPIVFDSIAKQKWNNVLFINNNPKNNGGYEFKDFKWFKNDKAVDSLQFYSAGPKSTDVLKASDVYKVTMHTKDGVRISTCKGSPKIIILPVTAENPAVAKQVLGINGKTAKPEQKVYNAYGAERKNTPAGVYIIKDK
jgi:uncharacterized repeat protein (TIGR02543 family)